MDHFCFTAACMTWLSMPLQPHLPQTWGRFSSQNTPSCRNLIWTLGVIRVGSFVINPGNFALFCRECAEHRVGPKWNSGQPTPGASLCFGQRPASPDSPDRRGRPSASSKYSFLTGPSVLYNCFPRAQFRLGFSFAPKIRFPEVRVI